MRSRGAVEVVVPAGPCCAAPRQQRGVGVQDRLVALVGDRAEDLALGRRGVGQHRERLVGVGGDHDLVVALGAAAVGDHLDIAQPAGDGAHRRRRADSVRERRGQRIDVAPRAAGHGAPARPVAEAEHAVVGEERRQEAGRERPQLVGVGRPHGRGLGDDQPLDEPLRVAAAGEQLAQRGSGARRARGQRARLAIEAEQVADHPQEARVDEVRALREDAARRSRVLERAGVVGDREAHARRLGRDAQLGHQRLEAGVVAVVVDDEAGVDPVRLVGELDAHRVNVAAEVGAGLVEHDLVVEPQPVGGGQSSHAAADDRDSRHVLGDTTCPADRMSKRVG